MIVFNLSGHGFLDLGAYDSYLEGKLESYALPPELLERALETLPQVNF